MNEPAHSPSAEVDGLAHAGGLENLVQLDRDHPGFRDPAYRARRDELAQLALRYRSGQVVPDAPYTDREHGVWAQIWARLGPLHTARVCRELLAADPIVSLPRDRIPQLSQVNPTLTAACGFRMEPVAGLVSARTFMRYLGQGVFLSTQYIRHHSRPLYTPEPDVVHELVGHAASLCQPEIAQLSRLLGAAAADADEAAMWRLMNVYWWTLEFGLVQQDGQLKALGAGLLSSIGELEGFESRRLEPWDLERMAGTAFDPTDIQPQYFVAPSFSALVEDLRRWVHAGG